MAANAPGVSEFVDAPTQPDQGSQPQTTRMPYRQILGLVAVILISELTAVQYSLVSMAVPVISSHYRTTEIAWALTIPSLVAAVALCLVGKLADLKGKRLVLLIMIALATAGAVLCAVAPTFELFLAGRTLQGFLYVVPLLAFSLIRDVFPKRLVAFATAVAFTGSGVGLAGTPFLVGWLLDSFGLSSLFWFMVIYQVVCLIIIVLALPESPLRQKVKLDWLGALLLGLSVLFLMYALSNVLAWGWTSANFLGLVLAGAVCFGAWLWWEKRFSEPLIDLALLRTKAMLTTVMVTFAVFAVYTIVSATIPIMVQTPREFGVSAGFGVQGAGIAYFLAPLGAGLVVGGLLVGAMARRWGIRTPMLVAFVMLTLGCFGLAYRHSSEWEMVTWLVLCGVALGIAYGGYPNLVLQATPPESQAVASSFVSSFGNMGGVLSIQIAFMVLTAHIAPGSEGAFYQGSGYEITFVVTAVIAIAGFLLTLIVPHGRRRDVLEMRAGEDLQSV
jgi:MFS family permease